ncbi:MAG TPA: hypothetical protein VKT30_04835 [Caulobacteraceae bacterium]|nr:hypothetical protein [Caulobacteraceae bacterium]
MPTTLASGANPDAIIQPLIIDFLHWLDAEPRAYAEVMEFWRTSCPRLTVWEDAIDRGFVERRRESGATFIALTPAGRRALAGA